jgi:hypothetical protein
MLINQSINQTTNQSSRRRDLYLKTHNTHNRQISMHSVGFETSIPGSQRPQAHTLDHVTTGTGTHKMSLVHKNRPLKRHHAPNAVAVFVAATFSFMKFHRLSIQINQPTRRNNSSSLLLDVYLQLNMFRASSRPSSGAQQLQ